jgi:hypothetical protein
MELCASRQALKHPIIPIENAYFLSGSIAMQVHIFDYQSDSSHLAAITLDPTGENLPNVGDHPGTWRFARSIHPSAVPAITSVQGAKDRLASEGFLLLSESEIVWRSE